MNTAFDILVIALSALLALLLIMLIVIVMKIKRLIAAVHGIVNKGEQVVLTAEAAAEMVKRAAGPLGAIKSILSVMDTVTKYKERKGKDE